MTPNTSLRPPHVLVPMHIYVPTYVYTRPIHENGKPIIFVLVCMCVSKQVLRPKCGDQRTTSGINSLLLPHEPSGTNLGSQAWRQEPLPTRSSPHPFKCKTYTRRKVSNCRTFHNCWWRCYFALLLKKRTIKSAERVPPHPCKPTLQPYIWEGTVVRNYHFLCYSHLQGDACRIRIQWQHSYLALDII